MNKFDIKSINSIMSEEIEHFSSKSYLKDEEGKVISIGDGIAKVSGLKSVMLNEIVRFETGVQGIVLNLEKDVVGVVLLGKFDNIEEGNIVYRTYKVFEIPVGYNFIGRTIDATGKPIDGKGPINPDSYLPIEKVAPGVMSRESVNEPLETGILSIDAMFPIGKGQRELIIGDRQTGKTTVATDTIINQKGRDVYCIYVAIGQKNSTIAALARNLEDQGAMEYTTIVSASASDLPALQYIAPYAGVTLAEYLMSQGKNVLIVYDDLSKHAVAYRTLSLLLKRPPGREAYPGDVFYLHSRLLERACKLNKENGGGSITALPIIETQAGDISAYIPTNVISITDGQIFMMSSLFNSGQRPAIDAGLSVSRVGGAAQIKSIKQMSSSLKLELASYRELDSFSQFGSDLDETTKATLEHGERIMQMLRQLPNKPYCQTDEAVLLFAIKERYIDMVPTQRIIEYKEFLLKKIHNQSIWKKLDEQREFTKDELVPAFKSSVYDITLEFLGLIKQELDAEEYDQYLEKLLTLKPEEVKKELETITKVDEVKLVDDDDDNDTIVVIEQEDEQDSKTYVKSVEFTPEQNSVDSKQNQIQQPEELKEKICYSFGDIEDPDNIKYFNFDDPVNQNHRVLIESKEIDVDDKITENDNVILEIEEDTPVETVIKPDYIIETVEIIPSKSNDSIEDETVIIKDELGNLSDYSFGEVDQTSLQDQIIFGSRHTDDTKESCECETENVKDQTPEVSIKDQLDQSNINFEFDDIEDQDNIKYFDFNKKQPEPKLKPKQSENSNNIFKVNENWGSKISEEEILKREKETLKVVKEKDLVSKSKVKDEKIDKISDITIMISLSLEEAINIIENGKTVLFFKKLPVQDVKRVIVYLVKNKKTDGMVIGEFILEKKEKLSRTKAWNDYGKFSTLKKSEFTEYFKDEKSATIMLISDFLQYRNPRQLKDFGISKGPAGFVYLK